MKFHNKDKIQFSNLQNVKHNYKFNHLLPTQEYQEIKNKYDNQHQYLLN